MSTLRSLVTPLVGLLVAVACAPDRLTNAADTAPAAVTSASSAAPLSSVSTLAAPAPARADRLTEPRFLQPAPGAPTIANPVVRFWAQRGVDKTAEMYYHRAAGGRDSVVFFSLRLRAKSLLRRPNGTPIADGDSVLITLTLVDAQKGIVDCQPSGLRFDPGKPARVKISFAEADDDVNHDGAINVIDAVLTRVFAVWRKESPAEPWIRVPSVVSLGTHEVEAEIGGFTGYAIAW